MQHHLDLICNSHSMRAPIVIFYGLFIFSFTAALQTVSKNKMLDNAEKLVGHINRDNTD